MSKAALIAARWCEPPCSPWARFPSASHPEAEASPAMSWVSTSSKTLKGKRRVRGWSTQSLVPGRDRCRLPKHSASISRRAEPRSGVSTEKFTGSKASNELSLGLHFSAGTFGAASGMDPASGWVLHPPSRWGLAQSRRQGWRLRPPGSSSCPKLAVVTLSLCCAGIWLIPAGL